MEIKMAHAITVRKNGKAEMAYVGQKPWHGLGQELEQGAPIEKWLVAAGMDWKVQRSKVRFATQAGQANEFATWDDYHVLMRSDTKAPLGMVSDKYKVVQPHDVLEFFRDLVEVAGFTLETAGTLYGGQKFWALANIGAEDTVVKNDLVRGRLMLATSCDGSMKTTVKNVTERVVCANTLAIAMGEKGAPEVSITHRTKFDGPAVKRQLGVAVDSFARFMKDAREMSKKSVSPKEFREFMGKVLNAKEDEDVADQRAYQAVSELFYGAGRGAGLPGVRGTVWGAVNAVTEYVDHYRPNRSLENRINSAWFGIGGTIKERALETARELVYVAR